MVIDRVRDSTNEVGGRLIELQGAEYMVRGLGYLRSLARSGDGSGREPRTARRSWSGISERSSFGPDMRRGVAEWNGEGETVAGIVVMR